MLQQKYFTGEYAILLVRLMCYGWLWYL